MPIHEWTRVSAGTFHYFHQRWMGEIADVLNDGLLPSGFYAMTEQFAAGFGPDVLTLEAPVEGNSEENCSDLRSDQGGLALARVDLRPTAETDMTYYRRKQNTLTVRDATGDRVVAVAEIVSRGNKSTRDAVETFVRKAAILLERGVHLLIIDLYPPGARDPAGIHGEIWQAIAGEEYTQARDKPLTLAAYESGEAIRAFVVGAAVGDVLTDMPLFLQPGYGVMVPLEKTYNAAFARVPLRRRDPLEQPYK